MDKEEKAEKIQKFVRWYKKQSKATQNKVIAGGIFGVLFCIFLLGIIAGWLLYSVAKVGNNLKGGVLYYGFASSAGRIITTILVVCSIVAIIFLLVRINRQNAVVVTDERGVRFLKDGTHGTSRWMEENEAKNVFEVNDIYDTSTTIYGQFSEKGEKVVGYTKSKGGATGNQNNLIVGPPGTGKSFTFVRTELLQSVKRGESFVVTDPSGELYTSISQYCRNNGYDVKVLNLNDPDYSDCWDCLQETINPETERLDSTRLSEFVNIYMKNSSDSEGKSEQKFWYDSATNLLTAVIGFVSYKREKEIIDRLKELYKKVNSINPSEKMGYIELKFDEMSFTKIKAIILEDAKRNGFDLLEIQNIIDKIFKTAPEYNIGKVYDYLMDFNKYEDEIAIIPSWHPAAAAYKIFRTNASNESVRGSALQGSQMRMLLFSDKKVRAITSRPGINLAKCNESKSAYFIIMSDKTTNLKPIASLCFSFLFKDSQNEWDKAQMIADEKGVDNPRIPINIILDEFFSVGVIGGSPKAFTTTMANSRKRQLHISIIVQSFPSQVEELYGLNNTKTILGCCDTILVLGCKDDQTARWVSGYIGSSATVQSESHKESGGLINETGTQINASSTSRPLLTVDEARTWKDKVLCARQNQNPLALIPFPWVDHPAYVNGEITKVSLYNGQIKNVSEMIDDEIQDYSDNDPVSEVHNAIENLKSDITVTVDDLTGEVSIQKNNKKQNKKEGKKPSPKKQKFEQTRLQDVVESSRQENKEEIKGETKEDSEESQTHVSF